MNTRDLAGPLASLLGELAHGAALSAGYILNGGDGGLLASLEGLTAAAASTVTRSGSSIAAHVDHVRYGLSLMNRWAGGEENPFASADWSASWRRTQVSDPEWRALRDALGSEVERWLEALRTPRDVAPEGLMGMIASVGHFAYHLGAIRQIDHQLAGPKELM